MLVYMGTAIIIVSLIAFMIAALFNVLVGFWIFIPLGFGLIIQMIGYWQNWPRYPRI